MWGWILAGTLALLLLVGAAYALTLYFETTFDR